MANKFIKWQHTKLGEIVSALACFGFAYWFFTLSVNLGNLLYYLFTLMFLVYFFKFSFRLIGELVHGIFH